MLGVNEAGILVGAINLPPDVSAGHSTGVLAGAGAAEVGTRASHGPHGASPDLIPEAETKEGVCVYTRVCVSCLELPLPLFPAFLGHLFPCADCLLKLGEELYGASYRKCSL